MLTITDLDRAANDDRYLGWGYLGERSRQDDATLVAAADQRVIDLANERGWDYEDLFAWANSKLGRWFGDGVFGSAAYVRFDQRIDRAVRENLFVKVEGE
jgi:hypothetical protein